MEKPGRLTRLVARHLMRAAGGVIHLFISFTDDYRHMVSHFCSNSAPLLHG